MNFPRKYKTRRSLIVFSKFIPTQGINPSLESSQNNPFEALSAHGIYNKKDPKHNKPDFLDKWENTPKVKLDKEDLVWGGFAWVINKAIQSDTGLYIVYSGGSSPMSGRKVHPLELFKRNYQLYLRGYCHERKEERIFKVDRITSLKVVNNTPQNSYQDPAEILSFPNRATCNNIAKISISSYSPKVTSFLSLLWKILKILFWIYLLYWFFHL